MESVLAIDLRVGISVFFVGCFLGLHRSGTCSVRHTAAEGAVLGDASVDVPARLCEERPVHGHPRHRGHLPVPRRRPFRSEQTVRVVYAKKNKKQQQTTTTRTRQMVGQAEARVSELQ